MRKINIFLGLLLSLFWSCEPIQNTPESVEIFQPNAPFMTVLGIAQDAGYPQANCQKECCKPLWKDPSKRKMVSCLAVVDPTANAAWILDATPDFKDQLYQVQHIIPNQVLDLKGILLTHAHMGHYTGLMHLGREAMGAQSVPVYAMPRLQNYLENNGPWSQLVALNNINIMAIKSDSSFALNANILVTPLEVPHRDEFSETVGYLVTANAKKALFIPDIDKWQLWEKDILAYIKDVDVAYLDGSFYQNGEIPGRDMSEIPHPFIEESMAQFSALTATEKAKVNFIHFNHTNPVLRADSDARKTVLAAGYQIAEEGDVFLFE